MQADIDQCVVFAMLELRRLWRWFALEQGRVGGETNGLQRNTAGAEVEPAVTVAVLIQLQGKAPRRHILEDQLLAAALLHTQQRLPVGLIGADQAQIQRRVALVVLHPNQQIARLGRQAAKQENHCTGHAVFGYDLKKSLWHNPPILQGFALKMRQVLVVHFSQTGQLNRLVQSVCAPLQASDGVQLDFLALQPAQPFPFPWPFLGFFRIFPETVLMKPQPLLPLAVDPDKRYDLIILAYQVWFLSPSLPCTSFLASPEAARLLKGTSVVTLIGCRNMWLMAQEKVKARLQALGAKLVDNVVLTDACGTAASFLATPLWMFTGRQKPYSWVPRAGIDEAEIASASRFGEAMARRLLADEQPIEQPMLCGLGAVKVDEKLIASEKVGNRSFTLWSRLLSALGPQQSRRRAVGLVVYIVFLICLIITVVPITAVLKKLLAPLSKARIQREKAYFAGPSGE